ncbi:hypothetical protein KAJ27_23580 [bacterium]|nr:hypothetical protein [bacterium]
MGTIINCHAASTPGDSPICNTGGRLLNLIDDCGSEFKIKDTKRQMNTTKSDFTILDNGGFNRHQKEKNGIPTLYDEMKPLIYKGMLNPMPIHLVQAAHKIQPDAIIASDDPVLCIKDIEGQEEEFKKKMPNNVKWAVQTAGLIEQYCLDSLLYIAFQGYSLEHIEIFFGAIGSIHCDGVSMPVRGQSIGKTALFLVKFWQMGFRNLHLLGTAALFPMAVAAYFAKHFFEFVSLDSGGSKIQASHSEYKNPHNLKTVHVSEDVIIDTTVDMDCQCPACRGRSFSYYQNQPYSFRRVLLCTHNFCVTERMGQKLLKHSGTVNSLICFLRKNTNRVKEIEKLHTVLSLVETLKNKDISYLEEFLA